jgi:hypothetical protein
MRRDCVKAFPEASRLVDSEAVTSVIRVKGGNFWFFDRLLTQIERIRSGPQTVSR